MYRIPKIESNNDELLKGESILKKKQPTLLRHEKCVCGANIECICEAKQIIEENFTKDVEDLAETCADIFSMAGIPKCKARASIKTVKNAFFYYDEKKYRIDALPRKRLRKEELIHSFGRKCGMSRLEAQICYTIIKRIFRAFYYGSLKDGYRDPQLDKQLKHEPECIWEHAAIRSSQIIARYLDWFKTEQLALQEEMWKAFRHFYSRMHKRLKAIAKEIKRNRPCKCGICSKFMTPDLMYECDREIKEEEFSLLFDKMQDKINTCRKADGKPCMGIVSDDSVNEKEENFGKETEMDKENAPKEPRCSCTKRSLKTSPAEIITYPPRCIECNCPRLICDCNVAPLHFHIQKYECNKCPFECIWYYVDPNEEKKAKPVAEPIPEEIDVCPTCKFFDDESDYVSDEFEHVWDETCEIEYIYLEQPPSYYDFSDIESKDSIERAKELAELQKLNKCYIHGMMRRKPYKYKQDEKEEEEEEGQLEEDKSESSNI